MNEKAAREIANRFLKAQADRDVEAARPLAAHGFQVVSPGGARTGLGPRNGERPDARVAGGDGCGGRGLHGTRPTRSAA